MMPGSDARPLLSEPGHVLGRLVASSAPLAEKVVDDPPLVHRLGQVVLTLDEALIDAVSRAVLPLFVHDWQLPAAEPLLNRLDADELVEEIGHLVRVGRFGAAAIARRCIALARKTGARKTVLAVLAACPGSELRDELLRDALDPSLEDAVWLVRQSGLASETSAGLLAELLRKADDRQLGSIVGDPGISGKVIAIAESSVPAVLRKMVFLDALPLDDFVRVTLGVLSAAKGNERIKVARRALERCLVSHFSGDELGFLTTMLGGVGEALDGAWVARLGLSRGIAPSVAGHNLMAFRKASQPARLRVVWSVNEVAEVLRRRQSFDLDAAAADACAQLLFEAEKVTPQAAVSAAGHLLPMLMRQGREPVSLIIAAAFPLIYRELRKEDDVPDLLKFVPFFDWDRCKAARQELVSAFMSSTWPAGDLALTACRCDDIGRILRRAARAQGGKAYLRKVSDDVGRLPNVCRNAVRKVVAAIR